MNNIKKGYLLFAAIILLLFVFLFSHQKQSNIETQKTIISDSIETTNFTSELEDLLVEETAIESSIAELENIDFDSSLEISAAYELEQELIEQDIDSIYETESDFENQIIDLESLSF